MKWRHTLRRRRHGNPGSSQRCCQRVRVRRARSGKHGSVSDRSKAPTSDASHAGCAARFGVELGWRIVRRGRRGHGPNGVVSGSTRGHRRWAWFTKTVGRSKPNDCAGWRRDRRGDRRSSASVERGQTRPGKRSRDDDVPAAQLWPEDLLLTRRRGRGGKEWPLCRPGGRGGRHHRSWAANTIF